MPNDTSPARPACQGIDPELFFGHTSLDAISACERCPVREECAKNILAAELEFALAYDENDPHDKQYRGGAIKAYGYAGGLTAAQRTGILTQRGRNWLAKQQLAAA